MKIFLKNLFIVLLLPLLFIKRFYYWYHSNKADFPGKKFAEFGFKLGYQLLFKGKISLSLLLRPVSIVRYFEFDFTNRNAQLMSGLKILDVSSPYLFGFYQSSLISLDYYYINPDKKDLANVISLSEKIEFNAHYKAQPMDALNLDYPDQYFDRVFSISVIEHISYDGDSEVMKEIWRVLKPEGIFVLTVPVKKIYEIEYRDKDEYNLNPEKKSSKYFFQRLYDKQKIEERLLFSLSNYEVINKKVLGVNEKNFYTEYKKRWLKYSFWETVKDPYYIINKFSYFDDIDDLNDIGVIGLTIRKLK